MPSIIDLSHIIEHGMTTDPRLPAPRVSDVWTREQSSSRYSPGVSFQIASVELPQNTGTYIDLPFHRHDGMAGAWDFPIERLVDLPGLLIDMRGSLAGRDRPLIHRHDFEGADLRGKAVLFLTGWDDHWGSDRYGAGNHPALSEDGANAFVEGGAAVFGVDSINADEFADLTRPAHTILLKENIPIVENLTGLDRLLGKTFRFTTAPAKVKGLGSFPVRAYATVGN
jgi:kynurenine formamidase